MLYYILISLYLLIVVFHYKFIFDDFKEIVIDTWVDICGGYSNLTISLLIFIPLMFFSVPILIVIALVLPLFDLLTRCRDKETWQFKNKWLARKDRKRTLTNGYEAYQPSEQCRQITFSDKNDLPNKYIKPCTYQVIYIEQSYNALINDYIQRKYSELVDLFSDQSIAEDSYEFIYIPRHSWVNNEEVSSAVLKYHIPTLQDEEMSYINQYFKTLNTSTVTQQLAALVGEDLQGPALFRVMNDADENNDKAKCSYYHLAEESDAYLDQAFAFYRDNLGHSSGDVYYQLASPSKIAEQNSEDLADYHFNYEAHKLAAEVQERIAQLQLSGFDQLLMTSLRNQLNDYTITKPSVSVVKKQTLSRLLITSDYCIKLIDFDGLEIKLTPLPKAVFFLFLRHQEGLILKHLCDHREELIEIYKALAYRESYDSICQSIDDVIDPTKNSINEKASRIKEAFVGEFSDDLARNYYITGGRGQKKFITLSRYLVVWEVKDLSWPFSVSLEEEKAKALDEGLYNWHSKAQKAMDDAKYKEAIAYLDEAIAICQYNYRSYMLRAICYFHILDYPLSEKDDDKAISLYPEPNVAHFNRAEVRLMQKKYDEALEDINVYLQIESSSSGDGHFLRGLIYMEKGMIDDARNDWTVAEERGHTEAKKYLHSH